MSVANPSAFPSGLVHVAPNEQTAFTDGMKLRDFFAAHALTGMLAYSHVNPMHGNYHENCTPSGASAAAFAFADAMLAERAKNTQTIIGTIKQAGRDEEGNTRLVIFTEESELKKLSDLPLYCPSKITIERCAEEQPKTP